MKVTVITISDRAYNGEYEDLSGPEIEKILKENLKSFNLEKFIVPDEGDKILECFKQNNDSNFIITTGGTGISSRDVTPDITKNYCDKELPGISEILRAESYKETPQAMLSRGYAGMKNKTIIVNFPGSVKAVRLCTKVIIPIMSHSIKMLNDEGH